MTANEQYMIDTWRASQQGAPMPPPPGRDDVAVLRSLRTYEQARAVMDGRSGRHPWRAALRRIFVRPQAS